MMKNSALISIVAALALVGCSGSRQGVASRASTDIAYGNSGAPASLPPEGAKQAGAEMAAPSSADTRGASMQTIQNVRRDIVRTGSLSIRVTDLKEGEQKVKGMVKKWDGYIQTSETAGLGGREPRAFITLRIPVSRFDEAVADLTGIGTLLASNTQSEDVTLQLVDMEARLKSMRAQEDAYRAILSRSGRIADVIAVQEKLSEIRTEIESMDAQRKAISDQAAFSTLTVDLSQRVEVTTKATDPDWMAQFWASATASLGGFTRSLVGILIWVVAWSPVWGAVLFFGWLFFRRKPPTAKNQA